MQSILIIDTPKNCPDCQLMADGWCYGIPSREEVQGKIKYLKRPSWCPLKDLPQKKMVKEVKDIADIVEYALNLDEIQQKLVIKTKLATDNLIAIGWNACLKEITE